MEVTISFIYNGRTYTRIENPGKYVVWGDSNGNPFDNKAVFNKLVKYYDQKDAMVCIPKQREVR